MASLVSASTMMTTSRKNPTLLSRVRSSRDNGFPRTASAMRNISWPPSRIGMGSRFRMARLIEKNATKVRSQSRPRRATWPEIWPTVMMPPTSRNEVWWSTSPFKNPSTTTPRLDQAEPGRVESGECLRQGLPGGESAVGKLHDDRLGAARDFEPQRGRPRQNVVEQRVPRPDRVAVHAHNPIAELEARERLGPGGQRVGGDRIDLRAGELRGARGRGETGVDEEREHRVHGDAREDHDRPFPHGLAVEPAPPGDRGGRLPAPHAP